ncbi:MAG: hypothetical protein V4717_05455 [Bacteroidota bacterium]
MNITNADIQYLPHAAIDKQHWDHAIRNAKNRLVYAQSACLDILCPDWDALATNNYGFIMPLPWKKKWGIRYLYQPFGFAQGGIFYSDKCSPEIVQLFIERTTLHFSYGTFDLNEANDISTVNKGNIIMRDNYVLDLLKPYEENFNAFNKDAKKNLRQAKSTLQQVIYDVPVNDVVDMYKAQYGLLNKSANSDYEKLGRLVNDFITQDKAFSIGVEIDNKLVSSAIFLKDANRLYYVLGAPTTRGKEFKSMHLLIDHVIKTFSNTNYQLDFEGSDIPSVATFYKKFAPVNRQYPRVHFNRLPLLIRWLKP